MIRRFGRLDFFQTRPSSFKSWPSRGRRRRSWPPSAPPITQVLINVEVPRSGGVKEMIMDSRELAEAVKNEEAALGGEGRGLVRASGTEALIRVMVEAKTTEIAKKTADSLVSLIKSLKF